MFNFSFKEKFVIKTNTALCFLIKLYSLFFKSREILTKVKMKTNIPRKRFMK